MSGCLPSNVTVSSHCSTPIEFRVRRKPAFLTIDGPALTALGARWDGYALMLIHPLLCTQGFRFKSAIKTQSIVSHADPQVYFKIRRGSCTSPRCIYPA